MKIKRILEWRGKVVLNFVIFRDFEERNETTCDSSRETNLCIRTNGIIKQEFTRIPLL